MNLLTCSQLPRRGRRHINWRQDCEKNQSEAHQTSIQPNICHWCFCSAATESLKVTSSIRGRETGSSLRASVTESAGKIHNFSFSDDQIRSALMFDLCKCLVCKDLWGQRWHQRNVSGLRRRAEHPSSASHFESA